MNFFRKLLSNTANEESTLDWIQLIDMPQLDTIIENSKTKTQAIFKHSPRCGISSSVLRKFEQQFNNDNQVVELYFLDLINYRSISNEIAERFDIRHESPQLLIIKNGVVVAHESHYGILDIEVSK